MTIEERIQARFHMKGKPHGEHRYYEVYKECVDVATEQDLISRKEERERCLNTALKACCKSCLYACMKDSFRCSTYNNILKALEGGNNEQSN